jgi:hypothetical protein
VRKAEGAGADLSQDGLGHADPSTTKMIYAHYAPKKLRAVVLEYSASPAELVVEIEAEEASRRAERASSEEATNRLLARRVSGPALSRQGRRSFGNDAPVSALLAKTVTRHGFTLQRAPH